MRTTYQAGMRVVLVRAVVPWYSGYGSNRAVTLPAGLEGVIQSAGVVKVRGRGTYDVARFELAGEQWETSEGFAPIA